MSSWPAAERIRAPRTPGDERTSLETWLEYHRATLLIKCAGLEPEQLAMRSCPPSSLSLLGLVRHLTEVETWFHDFDGQPHGVWYCTYDEPDGEFDLVDPARADADLAAYHASVHRARTAIEDHGLDDPADTAFMSTYGGAVKLIQPEVTATTDGILPSNDVNAPVTIS